MKNYLGKRSAHGAYVVVRENEKIKPLRHVVLHSPTGLEFGYGGSGPADTALSILADYFGERPTRRQLHRGRLDGGSPKCLSYHQDFKWDFISKAPQEGFEICGSEIQEWLERQESQVEASSSEVLGEGRR